MFKIIQKFLTVIVLASFIAQPMLSACECPSGACTCPPTAPQKNSQPTAAGTEATQEQPTEATPVPPVTDSQPETPVTPPAQ